MALFKTLFSALARLFCVPSAQKRSTPEEELAPPVVPHEPHQRQEQLQPEFEDEDTEGALELYCLSIGLPERPQPRPWRLQRVNQVNQQNEYYCSLRAQAKEERKAMVDSIKKSREAYTNGDGALAKALSNQSKIHRAEMKRLNEEASEWIFTENNKDCRRGEVDLHGLHVKEAIAFTELSIRKAIERGDLEISLIVGKGLHSRNGPKIKPAIEELMHKYKLIVEVDPCNAGILIVSLDGIVPGEGRIMLPEDISMGIEGSSGEDCIVM